MAFNPQVLAWARNTAGLSVSEAAHSLGFTDTHERSGAERLQAMEVGTEEPSRSVLSRMARTYHRPLLVFYLSKPPAAGDRGQDFRRAPGATPPEYDPTLDALIRDIRGRQSIVRDLFEQTEPRTVDYVGSVTMDKPAAELARDITKRLGFSLDEYRRQPTVEGAFSYLRAKIEGLGAFVLLLGNLGSHHTNIPSGVFRGYAIADPVAPFIVVNDQDAHVAWAFTALHELTHLWLGATGISGDSAATQLESYCNNLAGEILLPEGEINELRFLSRSSLQETVAAIAQFANARKISRTMVAYRLLRVSIIADLRWRELHKHYQDEWAAAKEFKVTKDKKEGGPSYYVVKQHRLGHALVDLIRTSLSEGFITATKAGRVLGVKPRNVEPLIYMAAPRGGK